MTYSRMEAVAAALASRAQHTPFPIAAPARPIVRLGLCSSLSRGFLRDLVRRLATGPGAPELAFCEAPAGEVLRAARRRSVDIAFVCGEQDWGPLKHEAFWPETFVAALPEHHRLAAQSEVPARALLRERFLAHGGAREHARQAALIGHALGAAPAELDCLPVERETLVDLVGLGQGVALVAASSLATFHPGVVYRPIAGGAAVPFFAAWRAHGSNPAQGPLLATARALAAQRRRAPAAA